MKVLTVTGPWAWAIRSLGKDIENRSWSTLHRGPLAIHSGKCRSVAERGRIVAEVWRKVCIQRGLGAGAASSPLPAWFAFEMLQSYEAEGKVVAVVELSGCRRESGSVWADWGNFFWQIQGVEPLAIGGFPVVRGNQGLWSIDDAEIAARAATVNETATTTEGKG